MRVLGIETSCDETGVALYDGDRGLLAHALYSQAHIHAEYGGVVPEIASRDHVRKLLPLLNECLADAGCGRDDIDAVLIATGDRWHTMASILAAKAGKDMYTEKPLGVCLHEDLVCRDVVRRYGRMFHAFERFQGIAAGRRQA